ncbi:MAG: hemin uptake protein HemP [Thauera sp.]|uniref:hemin uptake protein HemP n=1 Tax=Thauera sp. JM12B12 TaxID=3142262 RepID=UPI0029C3B59C|nr:hemin uptake protein HemP [Thauera sp.]
MPEIEPRRDAAADASAPGATTPAADDRSASAGALSSSLLLGSQRAVTIEHDGTQYVLRATRNGKLILTK